MQWRVVYQVSRVAKVTAHHGGSWWEWQKPETHTLLVNAPDQASAERHVEIVSTGWHRSLEPPAAEPWTDPAFEVGGEYFPRFSVVSVERVK